MQSPAQIRRLTAGLQEAAGKLPAGVPLLVGADQEHGTVTRIRDGRDAAALAMAFGAARDPALTEQAAFVSGTELAALGVNVDFAPVADVTRRSGQPVIGSRSYGSDPALVVRRRSPRPSVATSGAASRATLKHFPGHGHTTPTATRRLPVLPPGPGRSWTREDMPPFRAGIEAGAWLVMSGHLDVRAIEPGRAGLASAARCWSTCSAGSSGSPAWWSPTRWTWRRPTGWHGPAEAAVRAVLAGNDLLLMPPDLRGGPAGLLDALQDRPAAPRPRWSRR